MAVQTYNLQVGEIGSFEIRRQTMSVTAKYLAEYNRISEGQENLTGFYSRFCDRIATLRAFIHKAPDNWDIENIDITNDNEYDKIEAVYRAITDKEASFRSGGQTDGQATSAGSSQKP